MTIWKTPNLLANLVTDTDVDRIKFQSTVFPTWKYNRAHKSVGVLHTGRISSGWTNFSNVKYIATSTSVAACCFLFLFPLLLRWRRLSHSLRPRSLQPWQHSPTLTKNKTLKWSAFDASVYKLHAATSVQSSEYRHHTTLRLQTLCRDEMRERRKLQVEWTHRITSRRCNHRRV